MAYTERFGQSDDYRREELIRIIEHSVEKLTLAELEALYYDMTTKSYVVRALMTFCVIEQDDVQPKTYTTFFRSVIAFGRIHIIEDETKFQSIVAYVLYCFMWIILVLSIPNTILPMVYNVNSM